MTDRHHDEAMAEAFKADPAYAAELLASIKADGKAAELAILRRQMAKAGLPEEGAQEAPVCNRRNLISRNDR